MELYVLEAVRKEIMRNERLLKVIVGYRES